MASGRSAIVLGVVPKDTNPGCHPTAGAPLFVARLGYQQQRLTPLLAREGVRMTASPLYYTPANPQLSLLPGAVHGLGVALDPCLHIRQAPREERARLFRELAWGGGDEPFDPEQDALTPTELVELAVAPLELERGRGATLLLAGGHLVGEVGTRGRELELKIVRIAAAHFKTERMDEPPEQAVNPMRRELFAVIAVPASVLRSERARRELAQEYLKLDGISGFWVKIEGFSERGRQQDIRAGGAFLADLREGGRAVVGDQSGLLHLGLLADGISSAIGLAQGEVFSYPTNWPRTTKDGTPVGRVRSAYHPKYLRSFRVNGPDAARVFGELGCTCGTHRSSEPPDGQNVEAHAAVVRSRQAQDALDGTLEERREWLLAASAMATHAAHDAGVDAVPPIVFEQLFAGLDRVDQELRETG
jgi:hypothetical protein